MTKPTFDNTIAFDEGWGIFECRGSENGRHQLQKLDESDELTTDMEAWRLVVEQAASGSDYHVKAMQFLKDHSRVEHDCIVDTVAQKPLA
ncbi:hypothetical protein [Bradyrhizobium sp. SZCCHNS3053]|uniref:hypothetical protein n=1 Tax=Bradyrhizobium sp. SZCCHNS3053 TaxID=3057322 RepID=UPI002916B825|nr:hypothetical protein [Bradyrhizobium sp. SZCCHNS3053]